MEFANFCFGELLASPAKVGLVILVSPDIHLRDRRLSDLISEHGEVAQNALAGYWRHLLPISSTQGGGESRTTRYIFSWLKYQPR